MEDVASLLRLKVQAVQSELATLEVVVDSFRELVYDACKQSTAKNSGAQMEVVPAIASLVAFPQTLRNFDPSPFSEEPYLSAFNAPSTLLRPQQFPSTAAPLSTRAGRCGI